MDFLLVIFFGVITPCFGGVLTIDGVQCPIRSDFKAMNASTGNGTGTGNGGICILPEWWNKAYLCSDDHLEPLAYGCHEGSCILQCERGHDSWCYPVRSVCGEWKYIDCTKHSDCAPMPDQKCHKKCSKSQL